jgi:hypothetical protein
MARYASTSAARRGHISFQNIVIMFPNSSKHLFLEQYTPLLPLITSVQVLHVSRTDLSFSMENGMVPLRTTSAELNNFRTN